MKYAKRLINGFESIEITVWEDGTVHIDQGDHTVSIPEFMLKTVVSEIDSASAQVVSYSDGE